MMSASRFPFTSLGAQVASAIDLIVQLDRYSEDGSRKISRITEVVGLDERGQYVMQDIFECHLTGKTKKRPPARQSGLHRPAPDIREKNRDNTECRIALSTVGRCGKRTIETPAYTDRSA